MTFEKVARALAEYKGLDAAAVTPESTFADLKLDSLDVADLVMSLEDAFGVTIELDGDVKTVGDLAARIEGAQNA
ncbi:MAG: acyl carrier protein [Clostridiales bacterium]|nr:acyl carrier protein [Clostridiales bacterium]